MFYTHQHRGQKIIFSFSRRQTLAIQESCTDLVYLCDLSAQKRKKKKRIEALPVCIYCSKGNQNAHENVASHAHLLLPQEVEK